MFSNLIFMTLLLGVCSDSNCHDSENVSRNTAPPPPQSIPIPMVNGEPVQVNISAHILYFSVSTVAQEFDVIMYLRKEWRDPRLAYNTSEPLGYRVIYDEKLIWTPDLFFVNEIVDSEHVAVKPKGFIHIYPDGYVSSNQRVNIKASCPMDLTIYPFDTQICQLNMESYNYTTKQMIVEWNKTADYPVTGNPTIKEFQLHFNCVSSTIDFHGKKFGRTSINFNLKRVPTVIICRLFIPISTITAFSWVSSLLDRKEVFIRMTLCLAPIITYLVQLNFGSIFFIQAGYLTGLDIWAIFCFSILLGSLFETIFVIWLIGRFYDESNIPGNELYKKFDSRCRMILIFNLIFFHAFAIIYIIMAQDF